jgi:hypothetical protein
MAGHDVGTVWAKHRWPGMAGLGMGLLNMGWSRNGSYEHGLGSLWAGNGLGMGWTCARNVLACAWTGRGVGWIGMGSAGHGLFC